MFQSKGGDKVLKFSKVSLTCHFTADDTAAIIAAQGPLTAIKDGCFLSLPTLKKINN
jgi:hypothetical protein